MSGGAAGLAALNAPGRRPRELWSGGDAYFEWALGTGLRNYGHAVEWVPLLLELKGSARSFARRVAGLKGRLGPLEGHRPAHWTDDLRLPPYYDKPSPRVGKPTRYISLLAKPSLVSALLVGETPVARSVLRFEVGRATACEDLPSTAPPAAPPCLDAGEQPPSVVVGIVDQGIPFALDRLRDAAGGSRVEFVWDQRVPSAVWGDWGYGRELTKRDPVAGIKRRFKQSTFGGQLDEDRVYHLSEWVDRRVDGLQPLGRRATHGAHVADLACGESVPPPPGTAPIVAVELPYATVDDTSCATLGPQVYNALMYTLACADKLADLHQVPPLPVVVNLSFGAQAPVTGNHVLHTALDELLANCNSSGFAPLRLVLPAGNSRHARGHARFKLAAGASRTLSWRLMPDGHAESELQIWLPPGVDTQRLSLKVYAPDQPDPVIEAPQASAQPYHWTPGADMLAMLAYPPAVPGKPSCLRLFVQPTTSLTGEIPVAPAGRWRVSLHNQPAGGTIDAVDIWVQRGDTAPGHALRGRQSYLDDPAYARFDAGGRLIDSDGNLSTRNSVVKREGSLNPVAHGRHPVVAGGFRRSSRAMALYSAGGPVRPLPDRGSPSADGPDVALPCEDSPAAWGVLASGVRSGSCAAMGGTSVAAPQAARWVAQRAAAGMSSDRQALHTEAVAKESGKPDTPPARRAGGGRVDLGSARPSRTHE